MERVSLYRRILRLHKQLPSEMRLLGDLYVKEEVHRHRNSNKKFVDEFVKEWGKYADILDEQLNNPAKSNIGKKIDPETLTKLSGDQIVQLYDLKVESTKAAK
ncbi:ACN9-domain-containing protein [Rozella allomycis CSF55]|uniref:Succinate dehydrogenase assembly factor 3 n=1 Tax=Rozella allomycis (strain CSF55) TaxID=988480 RepID=A0A4P9YFT7_ROZAC|nr:ACN9-domain-containing protein [Rozella allomycis CSF55]